LKQNNPKFRNSKNKRQEDFAEFSDGETLQALM